MQEVLNTKVRVDLPKLKIEVERLKLKWEALTPEEKKTPNGKLLRKQYIELRKVYLYMKKYYKPPYVEDCSIQADPKVDERLVHERDFPNLPMEIRKCIIPTNDANKFTGFKVRKGALLYLACLLAKDTEAVKAYKEKDRIYEHFYGIFDGTDTKAEVKNKILDTLLFDERVSTLKKRFGMSTDTANKIVGAFKVNHKKLRKWRLYEINQAKKSGHYTYYTELISDFNMSELPYKKNKNGVPKFSKVHAISELLENTFAYYIQTLLKKIKSYDYSFDGTILFDAKENHLLIETKVLPDDAESGFNYLLDSIEPFRFGVYQAMADTYESAFNVQ